MTTEELFEKHSDEEHLKFNKVANPRTTRHDLEAFLFLDDLLPMGIDIIAGAAHDEIFFHITSDQLEGLTEDQVIRLLRCGVRYSVDWDCLAMWV